MWANRCALSSCKADPFPLIAFHYFWQLFHSLLFILLLPLSLFTTYTLFSTRFAHFAHFARPLVVSVLKWVCFNPETKLFFYSIRKILPFRFVCIQLARFSVLIVCSFFPFPKIKANLYQLVGICIFLLLFFALKIEIVAYFKHSFMLTEYFFFGVSFFYSLICDCVAEIIWFVKYVWPLVHVYHFPHSFHMNQIKKNAHNLLFKRETHTRARIQKKPANQQCNKIRAGFLCSSFN